MWPAIKVGKHLEFEAHTKQAHPKCLKIRAEVYLVHYQNSWVESVCVQCKKAALGAYQESTENKRNEIKDCVPTTPSLREWKKHHD